MKDNKQNESLLFLDVLVLTILLNTLQNIMYMKVCFDHFGRYALDWLTLRSSIPDLLDSLI